MPETTKQGRVRLVAGQAGAAWVLVRAALLQAAGMQAHDAIEVVVTTDGLLIRKVAPR